MGDQRRLFQSKSHIETNFLPRAGSGLRIFSTVATFVAAALLLYARAGHPLQPEWERGLEVVIVGRFTLLLVDVFRGERPWPRTAIPGLAIVKLLFPFRYPGGQTMNLGLALSELAFVALLWKVMGARRGSKELSDELPEERLQNSLTVILPAGLAKLIAVEMVVLFSAARSVCRGFKKNQPNGYDYASASIFSAAPLLVLVMGPPDLFLLHAILRIQNHLVDLALTALDVWSILWLSGLYVTMCERPHTVQSFHIRVFQGILKSASIPLASICSTKTFPAGSFSRSELRGTKMTVPGAPCMRLELESPVTVRPVWGRDIASSTSFISAANPAQLARDLDSGQQTTGPRF